MRGLRRFAGALGLAAALLAPRAAAQDAADAVPHPPTMQERITSGLSQSDVPITATFTGSDILVFGAIERNRFFRMGEDTLPDVIVAITGPQGPLIVRRKERMLGVWANRSAVLIASAPAFYAVASTRPIDEILSSYARQVARIALEDTVIFAGTPFSNAEPQDFRQAVIRIRRDSDLYRSDPQGVDMLGPTLFRASFALPNNIIEGDYTVRVLLARDGRVIDERTSRIYVHKDQFGERMNRFSRERPLLYGLTAVLIALMTGWLASEAFRRLRR